ncbi:MAG: RNA recognition motif domain-containing protein [bacterium]
MNIYIGNLPKSTTEDAVRQAFESHGAVAEVKLIKDRDTGELRGFGFVEMPSKSEGEAAINELNGTDFEGQSLVVNEARPRR